MEEATEELSNGRQTTSQSGVTFVTRKAHVTMPRASENTPPNGVPKTHATSKPAVVCRETETQRPVVRKRKETAENEGPAAKMAPVKSPYFPPTPKTAPASDPLPVSDAEGSPFVSDDAQTVSDPIEPSGEQGTPPNRRTPSISADSESVAAFREPRPIGSCTMAKLISEFETAVKMLEEKRGNDRTMVAQLADVIRIKAEEMIGVMEKTMERFYEVTNHRFESVFTEISAELGRGQRLEENLSRIEGQVRDLLSYLQTGRPALNADEEEK